MRRRKEGQLIQKSAKNCQGRRGSIMVFAAFSLNGSGPIIRIAETMNGQS